MKKIAIIGHFGGNENFYDGQTVKTKNLERLLARNIDMSIVRVDTYYSKYNKVKLLYDTLKALFCCEHIFLLVSVNGMKVYFPLLYHLNRFTKKHIYHYIVGSELLELVEQNRKLTKYLNSFDANWFEYESGTLFLKKNGVNNVSTVPNFKELIPVSEVTEYRRERVYSFCTFSRVMSEKGITDAINAISGINKKYGSIVARLDIYGPVDPAYQKELELLLKLHSDYATYKGIVDSDKSVDVLKDYYALLFPTRWAGEGMPGTIIDAYAAGLPIIASDWNANKEIIENMKQGIIYPSTGFETLYDAIAWSIGNKNLMNQMRKECRTQFAKYMPETVLDIILKAMHISSHNKSNNK